MAFQVYHDSVENSWDTVSCSEETRDSLSGTSDEENLDDTLPIEALEEYNFKDKRTTHNDNLPLPYIIDSRSRFVNDSNALPKTMQEFRPIYCSSGVHLDSAGSSHGSDSFDAFSPQCCSSELAYLDSNGKNGEQSNLKQTTKFIPHFKTPAPVRREMSKLPSYHYSPCHIRMDSEEFRPQKCSTARSESDFKMSVVQENSNVFFPAFSSTRLSRAASMHCPLPSVAEDFKPERCSTGIQDTSVAFHPLRCSTGLNESTTFNPPMSSTAHRVNDSNIPEFKNLRMCSENNLL